MTFYGGDIINLSVKTRIRDQTFLPTFVIPWYAGNKCEFFETFCARTKWMIAKYMWPSKSQKFHDTTSWSRFCFWFPILPRLFFELFIIAIVEFTVFKKRYHQYIFQSYEFLLDYESDFILQVWFKGDQFPSSRVTKSGSRKGKKVDCHEEDVEIEYNIKT